MDFYFIKIVVLKNEGMVELVIFEFQGHSGIVDM